MAKRKIPCYEDHTTIAVYSPGEVESWKKDKERNDMQGIDR